MKMCGIEADGSEATYGQDGNDYSTARDFVIKQIYFMNDTKKYMERLEYYPNNVYGHQTFDDMIKSFAKYWRYPNDEFWQKIVTKFFNGHKEKIK